MNILFIGIGNMGGAILKSLFKYRAANDLQLNYFVAKKSQKSYDSISQFGEILEFEKEYTKKMNVIFLGMKPFQLENAVHEHLEEITNEQIVVSMAAGVTIQKLEEIFGSDKKIIRIMPNIPILVGKGMTSISPNSNCTNEDIELVEALLEKSSYCARIPEEKIHGFIGMAGSSPAFAFMFLEAMSDAGVKYGLTRSETYQFASVALMGASKMVLENLSNPGTLKDAVCSPGGTTIEGVCALEESGFRNSIIKGVSATIEKSIQLSKK